MWELTHGLERWQAPSSPLDNCCCGGGCGGRCCSDAQHTEYLVAICPSPHEGSVWGAWPSTTTTPRCPLARASHHPLQFASWCGPGWEGATSLPCILATNCSPPSPPSLRGMVRKPCTTGIMVHTRVGGRHTPHCAAQAVTWLVCRVLLALRCAAPTFVPAAQPAAEQVAAPEAPSMVSWRL